MLRVRITTPEGVSHEVTAAGPYCRVGRNADNDIVLRDDMVSSYHCAFEVGGPTITLTDHGSRNGTWVNNVRLTTPHRVDEHSRIYVGSHLLELQRERAAISVPPNPVASVGSLLTEPNAHRKWRESLDRYDRYAKEWDERERSDHLALRAVELRKAQQWLHRTPPQFSHEISPLLREFIARSALVVRKQSRRRGVRRTLVGLLGLAVVGGAVAAWPYVRSHLPARIGEDTAAGEDAVSDTGTAAEESGGFDEGISEHDPDHRPGGTADPDACGQYDESNPDAVCVDLDQPIKHRVIPFETVEDVARRYGVSVDQVADTNLLNPDAPLTEGTELTIEHPKQRPLPQTKISYEVEPRETWTALAERFDVPAQRLRDYNPEVDDVKAGQEIAVWIDPKPYKPRNPDQRIPAYHIDQRAQSVGQPDNGKLEDGIQMPESDLYTRRNPGIMWGSSLTIASLQKAVATFRRDVDFDGVVILADISKKHGGKFEPHKSHQAGRDIDIWLPTLKGVYKTKYLDKGHSRPRKPHFEEVDWYATWGLVRALIQTGAVKYIFLDWRYQKYVYDAAVNMGATKAELDEWIQYPRHQSSPRGIFRHSQDHLSHIHVRFKCAPWEAQCQGDRAAP